MSLPASTLASTQHAVFDIKRPITRYAPSMWGDTFLQYASESKFEQQRVHVASAVECCMKQYNISQAEAYNFIRKDVEDYWKVINEECLKLNDIPKSVLEIVVNYARAAEVTYGNHQYKFTNADLLKDYISSLLLDPMCINEH